MAKIIRSPLFQTLSFGSRLNRRGSFSFSRNFFFFSQDSAWLKTVPLAYACVRATTTQRIFSFFFLSFYFYFLFLSGLRMAENRPPRVRVCARDNNAANFFFLFSFFLFLFSFSFTGSFPKLSPFLPKESPFLRNNSERMAITSE